MKSGQKCPDCELSGLQMGETFSTAKAIAQPFVNQSKPDHLLSELQKVWI